jgi:hypothetical protein
MTLKGLFTYTYLYTHKKMETITINGKTFYSEAPVSTKITQSAIGKWVLVRSINEGVNFGLVEEADETGIVLTNARRLWSLFSDRDEPAWYEGVSIVGPATNSNLTAKASKKIILEDYSITFCSDEAIEKLKNHPETKTTK